MESATEYFRGVEDVDVVSLPEGESGAGKPGERLTAERLDALARFWATPDQVRETWNGPKDYRELALAVGCRLTSLPKWKRHPMMTKRIADYILLTATLAMPNILWGQILAAVPVNVVDEETGEIINTLPGDTKAANYVGTIAKMIRSQGLTVHNTQVSPVTEITKPMDDATLTAKLDEYFERTDAE